MIKLYSTNCPKCKVLETKLKQKNIDFELITDFDVSMFTDMGIMSAPILDVDGKYMIFSEAIDFVNSK